MKFEELALKPQILQAIKELKYTELTQIQEKVIPIIQEGQDVVGQSSTGSGKTAAFSIPLLNQIEPGKGVQALILTPTRELCEQNADVLITLGKHLKLHIAKVYGGVSINPQMEALEHADIVVGTPGRILDHLNRGTADFSSIKVLILDEADKMFEMGFIEDVERIIEGTPTQRQTLLFSATMYSSVLELVQKYLHNPQVLRGEAHVDKSLLRQVYYTIRQHEKFSLLVTLLKHKTPGLALVFCATRSEVDIVTRNLRKNAVHAMAIHGGLSQNKRLVALEALKNEDIQVLVATDVAARGLDIRNVSHVYNYDVPKTSEEYVHRIGRTARAGMEGDAVTLLCERDYDNFNSVLRDRTIEIVKADVPPFETVGFSRREPGRDFDERAPRRGFHSQHDRRGGYEGHGGASGRFSSHTRPFHASSRHESVHSTSTAPSHHRKFGERSR